MPLSDILPWRRKNHNPFQNGGVSGGAFHTAMQAYGILGGHTTAEQQFRAIEKNLYASIIVERIASAAAGVPMVVVDSDGNPQPDHGISKLLADMNDRGRWETMNLAYQSYMITGDTFLYKVDSTQQDVAPGDSGKPRTQRRRVSVPQALRFIRTQSVSTDVDPQTDEIREYVFNIGSKQHKVTPEAMVHIRKPWPTDLHNGRSAAQTAADELSSSAAISQIQRHWLENGSIPPGILYGNLPGPNGGEPIPQEALEQMTKVLGEFGRDGRRAGRMPVFTGQWGVAELPRVMELLSLEQKHDTMSDIANAFGYPPILLKTGEGSTFENLHEAKLMLWEEKIVPDLLTPFASKLSASLGVEIRPDMSETPIQANQDKTAFERQKDLADVALLNERRQMIDLEPLPGGDVIWRPGTLVSYDENNEPTQELLEQSEPLDKEEIDKALSEYFSRQPKQIESCAHH